VRIAIDRSVIACFSDSFIGIASFPNNTSWAGSSAKFYDVIVDRHASSITGHAPIVAVKHLLLRGIKPHISIPFYVETAFDLRRSCEGPT